MEVAPVTSQPSGQFGMIQKNPDNLPGLEALSYMRELTVKQRRPGCLERKPHLIKALLSAVQLSGAQSARSFGLRASERERRSNYHW